MYPVIKKILDRELYRQDNTIELIASENFASEAVMKLCGSIFTNKYAEGYPGKRYYNGCLHMDEIEELAISVLKSLNVNQFEKDDFLLYPNPTNGFINIEYNKEVFKNSNLTIYDLRGNLVKNMILNQNNHPIFTTFLNLRKGFYIIKINEDIKKLIIK